MNDLVEFAIERNYDRILHSERGEQFDILPRMNAGDSRISQFGFLFVTTTQEGRGR